MGLQYRKSKKIGKNSRLTVSNKSLGVSTGSKNVRVSINSKGRTGISFRIPGTNIRFKKYSSGSNSAIIGSLMFLLVSMAQLTAWICLMCLFVFWWILKYTVLGTIWLYKKIFELCKSAILKIKNKRDMNNDFE